MPQPKKGARLGSNPSHQRQMLSNLALSLFEHERIKTTQAKAKLLRPFAEKLITKAKDGTVHNRRQVLSLIEDRSVVHKLFADIAPRFAERNGGYTRILKLGPRAGDGAEMALVELVEGAAVAISEAEEETTGRRRRLARPSRRREGLPEDKPARSRAAEAGAAGSGIGVERPDEETPPAGDEGLTEGQTLEEGEGPADGPEEPGRSPEKVEPDETKAKQAGAAAEEANAADAPGGPAEAQAAEGQARGGES